MDTPSQPATILIVDDSTLCRDMIAKTLRAAGLGTVAAVDGMEGLARLGQQRVDAVILDNEMPKMGGVAFLKALRSDARWKTLPVLMLTTTVAKGVIMEATKYGLSGYLLKARLSMPDMITRLRQALAKVTMPAPDKSPALSKLSVPNLVKRDAILDRVAEISAARTLSGVVPQISAIANSPHASISEISAVVKQDPILCIRIVQLAGSAAFGGIKVRLGSVEDAVRTIGISAVRDMAISMAVFQAFPAGKADGSDLLRCWQHALAVASIMGRIVPRTDAIPSGLPYMIGLCHDLAELLLRQRFPTEYAAALNYSRQAEVPLTELMGQAFGITYAELIESLLDRLKLPATIAAPIKEFEMYSRSAVDAHAGVLARSLAIANFLAHGILCAASTDSLVAPILKTDCRTVLIPTTAINLAEVRSQSITTCCILANVGPDQEPALMKPLLPKQELKVWYVPHPSFAALDPLEAALSSLCKAETHKHMPQPEELAGVKGFVIASPGFSPAVPEAQRLVTQCDRYIPILHVTRTASGNDEVQYPVTLSRLAEFISKLKSIS